jgi:hypothetical protein
MVYFNALLLRKVGCLTKAALIYKGRQVVASALGRRARYFAI